MKDLVEITCYNKTETMERKKALEFYLECMFACEGCEQERYTNVYLGLLSGAKKVHDGISFIN